MKKRVRNSWLAILWLALLSTAAVASVSESDGALTLRVTDIKPNRDADPPWQRIYNSANQKRGWFGLGWSTALETRIETSDDGGILVIEHGKKLRFRATDETGQSKGRLVGARWSRACCGPEYVTRVTRGYLRATCNGTQFFDPAGRLERMDDKNGNYIVVTYDTEGRPSSLEDKYGYSLRMTFGKNGLIAGMSDSTGRKTIYRYTAAGELVHVATSGRRSSYAHKDRLLTRVVDTKEGSQAIEYLNDAGTSRVARVTDTQRGTTEYAYVTDPHDPLHFSVTARYQYIADNRPSVRIHDFYYERQQSGDLRLVREAVSDDGDREETLYTEVGLPLRIEEMGQATTYKYDDRWRIVEKDTPSVTHRFTYDENIDKVAQVELIPKPAGKAIWFSYSYTPLGALTEAKSSDGRRVQLDYDSEGRVSRISASPERYLDYRYGSDGRLALMRAGADGSIRITYGPAGQIEVSRDPAGRKVALKAAAISAELMDLVRPAESR